MGRLRGPSVFILELSIIFIFSKGLISFTGDFGTTKNSYIISIIIGFTFTLLDNLAHSYFDNILKIVENNWNLYKDYEADMVKTPCVPSKKGFLYAKRSEVANLVSIFRSFQGTGILREDLDKRDSLHLTEFMKSVEETLKDDEKLIINATWHNGSLDFKDEYNSKTEEYFSKTAGKTNLRIFIVEKDKFHEIEKSNLWEKFLNVHKNNNIALYLLYESCLNDFKKSFGKLRSYEFGVITNNRGIPLYTLGIAKNKDEEKFYLCAGTDPQEYRDAIDIMIRHIANCKQGCQQIHQRQN